MNSVKRLVLVATLALTFATTALAKPVGFKACASDEKPVAIVIEVNDNASPTVVKNVATAFKNAAEALASERLLTVEGFRFFVAGLSEESKQSIEIPGPPVVLEGTCKAAQKQR
jgi:hypothetical protein